LKGNISRNPSISNNEGLNLLVSNNKNQNISYSNYSKNLNAYNNTESLNEKNDDFDSSIQKNLQLKIKNWLVSLNMIKEGAIKPIDIPKMCANGVFISDLINRLEGVIKKFL